MTISTPTIAAIQAAVIGHFGMRPLDMKSPRRARTVARPRQIAMYLAYELTGASFPAIGKHFGDRDHTTVMHAVRIVGELRKQNALFAEADTRIGDAIDRIIANLTVAKGTMTDAEFTSAETGHA